MRDVVFLASFPGNTKSFYPFVGLHNILFLIIYCSEIQKADNFLISAEKIPKEV